MVYLPRRADNGTPDRNCQPSSQRPVDGLDDYVYECQRSREQPYCWPTNGTRICSNDSSQAMSFYWPPDFYHEDAYLFIDFGSHVSDAALGPSNIRAPDANSTELTGYEKYAERAPNNTWRGEKILRITIREFWPYLDTIRSAVYDGPTLTLEAPRATGSVATPTSGSMPKIQPAGNDEGKMIGRVVGSVVGGLAVVLLMLLCCSRYNCCGCAGRSETERVRRLEARRLRNEVAAAKPQIEAIQSAVARREIWRGPVRPGGMWATEMPRRASRPASRASDEIRAVTMVEEQAAEERRIEERRQEIARAAEVQPPAYDEAPPRYTPRRGEE